MLYNSERKANGEGGWVGESLARGHGSVRERVRVYVCDRESEGTAIRTKRTMGVEIETLHAGDGKKCSI